jgi:glycosyltransferase involved in cell wall biosynthesis
MKVSVVICTWNRARFLDQTLTAMHDLRIPEGVEWELLVVNNKCTDDTDEVIAKHQENLPIRHLFEPNQGLSRARNHAVSVATGELILWTDDDVLMDPAWLEMFVAAARAWPRAAYFGGTIWPWYQSQPPTWVQQNLGFLAGMLVMRDIGRLERLFIGEEQPFGANMAFRADVLRRVRFNPELGYIGLEKILGEESQLLCSLRSEGMQGVWVPSAIVRHFVSSERMTVGFLWHFFLGSGRASVRMGHLPEGHRKWFGAPAWLYRLVLHFLLRSSWERLTFKSAWVRSFASAAQYSGIIKELCLRSRESRVGIN